MDSRSCNFTAAETNALLEGGRCHYDTIVGSFNSAKGGDTNKKKNDVWILITENVNAIGSGQRRTTDQIRFRWKNLKARATKDHAEAKNPQTGNKPFKRGDYTDVVLDIIGGEKSQALHGIQGVVGDGEPGIEEESQSLPPEADPEITFILNLSSVTEEEAGSSLVELAVVATGSQERLEAPFIKQRWWLQGTSAKRDWKGRSTDSSGRGTTDSHQTTANQGQTWDPSPKGQAQTSWSLHIRWRTLKLLFSIWH